MAVCDAHPGRTVRTVMFCGRRKSPVHVLYSGDLCLAVEEVLLARRQAGPEMERLERLSRRREVLSAADGFLLALVPLMDGARPLPEVVARGIAVAPALPAELREPVLESMQALAYSRGDVGERAGIREVLKSMPLPQDLYEDLRKEFRAEFLAKGREEGRAEGRVEEALRQTRESLLEDFAVLFGTVPTGVEQQVRQTEDIERLKGWRRTILEAGSAAAAELAVLGGR